MALRKDKGRSWVTRGVLHGKEAILGRHSGPRVTWIPGIDLQSLPSMAPLRGAMEGRVVPT